MDEIRMRAGVVFDVSDALRLQLNQMLAKPRIIALANGNACAVKNLAIVRFAIFERFVGGVQFLLPHFVSPIENRRYHTCRHRYC